nr:hypothetical protein [Tanacetum cinerariifolium]
MVLHTQLAMSPGLSARVTKAMTLSPLSFYKRYRSSYETPSPSSSLTLPVWKRGEEQATPEGQQQAVLVVDTAADEPLGLSYGALRRHELALKEGLVPSTCEIRQSFRSVSEQQRVEETPAPRLPTHTTWVDPMDNTVYTNILIYVPPVHTPIQTPPSPEWSSGSLPVSPSSLLVSTLIASPMTTPAYTPTMIDTESVPNEAPSKTYEFQPLAARTTPPSSDHTLISSDSTTRRGSWFRGEEQAAPEGQQQAVLVVDTAADEPLGLSYGALRCHELALKEGSVPSTCEIRQSFRSVSDQQRVEETPAPRLPTRTTWVDPMDNTVYTNILIYVPPVHTPIQTPPSPEWSSGSLPVSPSSLVVPTLIASPMTTPATTI